MAVSLEISARCQESYARVGAVTTPHGTFKTPAFMPVGTQGSVKGLLPDQVRDTGAEIILGNTYHLWLRPGSEQVKSLGGLQKWTRWQGPMLTDSGGYQVFSLSQRNKIEEQGVTFQSHLDGRSLFLGPEESVKIQQELGADIFMAFDDCPPARVTPEHAKSFNEAMLRKHGRGKGQRIKILKPLDGDVYTARVREACERTLRWLDRCYTVHDTRDTQALFPIVQGGTDLELRSWHAQEIQQREAPGYAIGGVAVGESSAEIARVVAHTAPLLPKDKPRYLMGVGYERDIVHAVRSGVDMFDCVLPTRSARHALAFTREGPLKLRNATFAAQAGPIDATCECVACAGGYSRAYLNHLFKAGETLAGSLVSLHNLHHFQRLMQDIRVAIVDNTWLSFYAQWPTAAPVEYIK